MQLLTFLSGLGILLLAMKLLEQSLAAIGEGQLRKALEYFSGTPLHGVVLGTVATAILQSSTVVSLMTMAFVGANLLPMRIAIGVVMGAGLGTTSTGWLVAFAGLGLDFSRFYVPLLGLGALMSVFGRENGKSVAWGGFLVALGFLLFSLELMKDSISFIVELVDVSVLRDLSPLFYYLFGILLTAVTQSSVATTMIGLSAMHAGIMDLLPAVALVIGAKLGTTSTLLLGSLKGAVTRRQVALISVLFNGLVSVVSFIFLGPLVRLVAEDFGISDPLIQLAVVSSLTSLAGIVVFLPFVSLLQRAAERVVPLPTRHTLAITEVSTEVPTASLAALEQDVRELLMAAVLLNAWRLGVLESRKTSRTVLLAETAQASYAELKNREAQLSDYILDLQRVGLLPEQLRRCQQLLVAIRDCLYSSKAVKDVEADLVRFRLESGVEVRQFIDKLVGSVEDLLEQAMGLLGAECCITKQDFRAMRDAVRRSHAESRAAVYDMIDQRGFKYDRASSALNINRELLLAAHSLINALEHFLLPGEQAATMSEWISTRA